MAKNFYDILGISSPSMREHFKNSSEKVQEIEQTTNSMKSTVESLDTTVNSLKTSVNSMSPTVESLKNDMTKRNSETWTGTTSVMGLTENGVTTNANGNWDDESFEAFKKYKIIWISSVNSAFTPFSYKGDVPLFNIGIEYGGMGEQTVEYISPPRYYNSDYYVMRFRLFKQSNLTGIKLNCTVEPLFKWSKSSTEIVKTRINGANGMLPNLTISSRGASSVELTGFSDTQINVINNSDTLIATIDSVDMIFQLSAKTSVSTFFSAVTSIGNHNQIVINKNLNKVTYETLSN